MQVLIFEPVVIVWTFDQNTPRKKYIFVFKYTKMRLLYWIAQYIFSLNSFGPINSENWKGFTECLNVHRRRRKLILAYMAIRKETAMQKYTFKIVLIKINVKNWPPNDWFWATYLCIVFNTFPLQVGQHNFTRGTYLFLFLI